jgi:T-complex protein 1 subunit gamma
MALSVLLKEKARSVEGVAQWPYKSLSEALEVIPRTLIRNCGQDTIRTLTKLRAKHSEANATAWGIDGRSGDIVDMHAYGIWEPFSVKAQTLKTSIEVPHPCFLIDSSPAVFLFLSANPPLLSQTATLLLRIDAIVSGMKKPSAEGSNSAPAAAPAEGEEQPQMEQD